MTVANPATLTEWLKSLPIPWLVSGTVGAAEQTANGTVLDGQVSLLKQAVKARFPSYAPADALAHIGGDRGLIQGAAESNTSFATRLRDAWSEWSRAGTALSVLEQLSYFGFGNNAVWVQQNGLAYQLSAAATAGQDPTSLLTITNLEQTSPNAPLTSSVTPTRSIPVSTPWWTFDFNTDCCNRFAIIVPINAWPFSALALASFTGTDSATVTWPVPQPNATYGLMIGPTTDSVTVWADGTAAATTGITIRASAPWTGNVWVTAFQPGVNPLNAWSSASFGQLQKLITTFRSNALCMGVISVMTGKVWGYPTTNTWGSGTWGGSTTQILGVF